MKVEVKKDRFEEIGLLNLSKIAHEALSQSSPKIEGKNVENIKDWLLWKQERFTPSATLLAYMKDDLVGWLALETSDSGIAEIWRWQPFISPRVNKQEVTVKLLHPVVGAPIQSFTCAANQIIVGS